MNNKQVTKTFVQVYNNKKVLPHPCLCAHNMITTFKIRKKIMNRSHSFWSLGFFSAGLLGAIFSQLNVTPTLHFLFC